MKRLALLAAPLLLVTLSARATAVPLEDAALCRAATPGPERGLQLPPHLLDAIGLVESGRPNPRTGVAAAWPWTINVAGVGHLYETKAAAIAAVTAAQLAGIQSIDVGCMQINLFYHSHAFANLDEAFDPAANTRYAASFLQLLRRQTGDWSAAIQAYHSATPERGAFYGAKVASVWPLAQAYGLSPHAGAPATSVASQTVPAVPVVDPYHVLTPEFRARLVQEAVFRRARDASLGVAAASSGQVLAQQPHSPAPRRRRGGSVQARLGG